MSSSIFGPVPSRRLGRSLGIDLVPYKTCTFDCVYCELGPTTCLTKERKPFRPVEEICGELDERLRQLRGGVDYITLAGSGEPTLNADIGVLIHRIKQISDVPLALLTNSSLLYDPSVRREILGLDLIVPSLDAVSDDAFRRINRPIDGMEIGTIVDGLIRLREEFLGDIWLEVLVCQDFNDSQEELSLIKGAAEKIRPEKIQVNTVYRPPAVEEVRAVSETRLKEIESLLGPNARMVSKANLIVDPVAHSRSVRERTLMLLKRRPCTIEDISSALCLVRIEVIKLIDQMVESGEIKKTLHDGAVYYSERRL